MWLIHPKPRPRELLSSWILRTSEMSGLKPHSFCHRHWPGVQIWNRDIDKLGPAALVQGMAEGTGVPWDRSERTTLRALEGVAVERLAQSSDSIVTNVGVYHRVRTGYGLRYCPECLAEPDTCYFRLEWRLLAVSTCPRHGSILRDDCDCGAPVIPGRGGIATCHACKRPLACSTAHAAMSASLQLDFHSISVIDGAPVSLPFLHGMHPLAYFALLSRLLLILACGPRRQRLWEVLENGGIEVPAPVFSRPRPAVRFLRVASIQDFGEALAMLLQGWPSMMVGLFAEADIWKSWALRDGKPGQLPYCYEDPVKWYLSSTATPSSLR